MSKRSFLRLFSLSFNQQFYHDNRITIPTLVTFMRIVLTPVIVWTIKVSAWKGALIAFLCAAFTDLIDGFLARYLNQKTFMGACLDPLADKILLISCFYIFAFSHSSFFYIPPWFFFTTLFKETIQIVGVIYLYFYKGHRVIEPTFLAKIATAYQVFFVGVILLSCAFNYSLGKIYPCLFFILCFLMVAAFINYVVLGISTILSRKDFRV